MDKISIGLIGYGVVGKGVVKMLNQQKNLLKNKFNTEFVLKTLCDRSVHKKLPKGLGKVHLTTDVEAILNDNSIDVVVELIGGMKLAKTIVRKALKSGKHVVTANKELIANCGKELFQIAQKSNTHLYYESAVGAGIPIIKTISEGIAGNKFNNIYGIVNGTCNYILTEMTKNNLSFDDALKSAQEKGYAEADPTLDINGMDSAHKLAILVYLANGKFLSVKEIHTEGITEISHDDIEYAESLNLTIKLLAIAKKKGNEIEVRVHPTLISKDHPLASINSVYNAFYLDTNPMGNILLSGEGAGQMAAASGVVSDLINLAAVGSEATALSNLHTEATKLKLKSIDQIQTRFYLRFAASDKPGVLSKITGILGQQGIGINSVNQKVHNQTSTVPVIMLTDYTTEKKLRLALNKIRKLPVVKGNPVAIRMEDLS